MATCVCGDSKCMSGCVAYIESILKEFSKRTPASVSWDPVEAPQEFKRSACACSSHQLHWGGCICGWYQIEQKRMKEKVV